MTAWGVVMMYGLLHLLVRFKHAFEFFGVKGVKRLEVGGLRAEVGGLRLES
jgi:hypothetical protein